MERNQGNNLIFHKYQGEYFNCPQYCCRFPLALQANDFNLSMKLLLREKPGSKKGYYLNKERTKDVLFQTLDSISKNTRHLARQEICEKLIKSTICYVFTMAKKHRGNVGNTLDFVEKNLMAQREFIFKVENEPDNIRRHAIYMTPSAFIEKLFNLKSHFQQDGQDVELKQEDHKKFDFLNFLFAALHRMPEGDEDALKEAVQNTMSWGIIVDEQKRADLQLCWFKSFEENTQTEENDEEMEIMDEIELKTQELKDLFKVSPKHKLERDFVKHCKEQTIEFDPSRGNLFNSEL